MKLVTYTVRPNIPKPLKPLEEIAHNLWLSWNFEAITLFIRLDYDAWLASKQNPVRVLGMVSQKRYEELAKDDSYLSALNNVYQKFKNYKRGKTWFTGSKKNSIAYFSMEYGLDVSLPVYSGGLGILSGDHMKTTSDLGIPLVGVGLLYRQGYFQQYLNADGFQQEDYPENDWYHMPVSQCRQKDGSVVKIAVDIAGSILTAQVWQVEVGRAKLYLLDTNIDENSEYDREITASLYGGDKEMRIRQEILLGIGGYRALKALGINPAVTHMNEGHSAFLALERLRELMVLENLSFQEAKHLIWTTNIFTTHTPVPAGNERFDIPLVEKYIKQFVTEIGLDWHEFIALGRENPQDNHEPFCMTILAIHFSAYNNGVSKLHGDISQDMWKNLWPGVPTKEIPITSITNGVHPRTWINHNMLDLMDRYFGPRFYDEPTNLEIWDRIDRISDEELWRTHERRKERLVAFARDRLRRQMIAKGMTTSVLEQAEDALSPYALTISFARRFATYKRGTLLFRDPDRLMKLLSNPDFPIQLIFAGKAHPHDIPGKELIKSIYHFANRPEVRSKIVFLENYDMTISRYLVSGSDCWLNTPRRPMEASGTSGMKAAMNGVLNISIPDGWWAEACEHSGGWMIGKGEEYERDELQDDIESKALYDLLEREIIPAYYNRGRDGLPREWIKRMKESIRNVGKNFSTTRMLMDYSNMFYKPALQNYTRFTKDQYADTRLASEYIHKLNENWKGIKLNIVSVKQDPDLKVGDTIKVDSDIHLGSLKPEDVRVELYYGKLGSNKEFLNEKRIEMKPVGKDRNNFRYSVKVKCADTGRQGYSVRVIPQHTGLIHPFLPSYITWG